MHYNFKFLFENGQIVVILKTKVAVNAVPEYTTDTKVSIVVPSYILQDENEH